VSRRGEARPVDDEITVPGRKEGRGERVQEPGSSDAGNSEP
jgi:hypothetical protein